jgi:nucleotide-binding universal stress UspA family protein
MGMFKRILCPTDLGERSFPALEKAVQIAHQFGSRITILNAHDEFMNEEEMQMLRVSVNKMKKRFAETAKESKNKMQESIKELHAEDIDIDYVLREGKPGHCIAEYANDHDINLIVMATDGRDNLMDFVKGTVTEHVINHAHCPTLVIPCKNK